LLGDLVAVQVRRCPHYEPRVFFCQTEESAHGRASPQATVGSSPCPSCLPCRSGRGACRRNAIHLWRCSCPTEQAGVSWIKRSTQIFPCGGQVSWSSRQALRWERQNPLRLD